MSVNGAQQMNPVMTHLHKRILCKSPSDDRRWAGIDVTCGFLHSACSAYFLHLRGRI